MSTVVVTDLPDPLVGRVIDGKYRILEPLGEGGMARVYTAEHLVLEHLVAVKFLRRELAVEPEIAERFAREAKTIAQLNSEHIVKVLDVGRLDGAGLFMVMEYLDGEDLQTRLGRIGPFPLAEAIGYVIQAAEGLDQAHQKGIVHRDLKPENLFLARSQRGVETIKLLDFGISKQTGGTLSRLTQPQVAIGSPNYMAPEQLMGYDSIDARADVWSLGVVLYRLATGVLPFTGQSIAEVYARILHTEPQRPSDVCPGLPYAFDDVVMGCLRKSPGGRPPHVRALATAL
ncbi:MAG TPA: serine/threonine-protein kinase, partial [Polyangiaceae bacterium]